MCHAAAGAPLVGLRLLSLDATRGFPLAYFNDFCQSKVLGNPIVNTFIMKKTKYLTTGAFAKLCRTTKETLFHYDRENLLKPKVVSENGYRRYGMEQIFDFDMISMLKDTGSSLKEIGHYIRHADSAEFLALLEKKMSIVKEERARLARRQTMLQDMAELTREAIRQGFDELAFIKQEEERLEVLPTVPVHSESTVEFVERFVAYVDFYNKEGRTPRYPFGVIIESDDVRQGLYAERYFFSRATKATPRPLVHIKPRGRYAVLAHQGGVQTHRAAYRDMLRQIQEAGLKTVANAYVYDLMSYILIGPGEQYAVKYCVQVE